jgi:hypothetical protein
LVAHLLCKQGVVGSSPIVSTAKQPGQRPVLEDRELASDSFATDDVSRNPIRQGGQTPAHAKLSSSNF